MSEDIVRELAFEAGYAAALTLAAGRVDDLDVIWRPIPRPSHENVVAARIAEMERYAAPEFLAEQTRRSVELTARKLAEARRVIASTRPALTTWREVHAHSTPEVWGRIWEDLAPSTQRTIADLHPRRPAPREVGRYGEAA